jgi:dipeptidyl aminopeptidase/acylaminoacyl peptidase
MSSGESGIALSPDGRRLAVTVASGEGSDIWIKELPTGPFTRFTFGGRNLRPAWSADGTTLLYVTGEAPARSVVVERRADGTGPEALVPGTEGANGIIRTGDPSRFVVSRMRDIILLDRTRDSATTRPFVGDPRYRYFQPALSPDGRWLAYWSDESGTNEVYVRPFPDASSGRWQVSRNGGSAPRWGQGGRELLYLAGRGNCARILRVSDACQMVSIDVRPGAGFTLGEQRALFPAIGSLFTRYTTLWALTPDEQRFIVLRTLGDVEEPASSVVIEVEHWRRDLEAARGERP